MEYVIANDGTDYTLAHLTLALADGPLTVGLAGLVALGWVGWWEPGPAWAAALCRTVPRLARLLSPLPPQPHPLAPTPPS